jgi:hypothetical protein
MNKQIISLIVTAAILAAVFTSCKDVVVPTYSITVVGGTADKTEATAGEKVTITAAKPQEGKMFYQWTTSDIEIFANQNAYITTFVMPAKAVTVTATYDKEKMNVNGIIISTETWTKVSASYDLGKTFVETVSTENNFMSISFSIYLPEPDALLMTTFGASSYFVSDFINISDKDVKVCAVSFYASNGDNKKPLGLISGNPLQGAYSTIQYIYLDKEVNISGTFTEPIIIEEEQWEITSEMNLQIKKGWNTIVTSIIMSPSNKSVATVTKVDVVPSMSVWMVIDTELMQGIKF